MSNKSGKLYLLFSILFVFISQSANCQPDKRTLQQADILFKQQKYEQSLQIYENILQEQQQYSPQLLLKLSFLHEISKNFPKAIYYLHLYYDKKPSRAVLKKIEELAQGRYYSGYEYSDLQFFKTQFNKYYEVLLQIMLMVAVVSVTIIFINWRRKKLPSKGYQLGFIAFLLFIMYYINFLNFGKQGIIQQGQVAIMSAPTAGSSWLATASEGHKINLTGETDIWYETEWEGKTAYIRKKNVLELP